MPLSHSLWQLLYRVESRISCAAKTISNGPLDSARTSLIIFGPYCTQLVRRIVTAPVHRSTRFRANNIRKIIVAIFTPYKSINWGTSTALRRPGFGVLPQGVSVFKGQEKSLESILKTSYLTYWCGRMIPHPRFLVSISMCYYTASY